jgi:hypothetical protein
MAEEDTMVLLRMLPNVAVVGVTVDILPPATDLLA